MASYKRLKRYVQSEIPIYRLILGDFEIDESYSSPFRKDYNPSFRVTKSAAGRLYWVDWGLANQKWFDAVGLVAYVYGVTRQQAINFVWNKLVKDENIELKDTTDHFAKKKKSLPYNFYPQHLRDWELEYWYEHLVEKELLEFFNIHSLAGLYRGEHFIFGSEKDNPAYIYLWEDNEEAFKSYRPKDPRGDKWRGQANGMWIQGWNQLPLFGEHLFVTTSLKDVAVLRGTGILSCAPQSETVRKAILEKREEINGRFRKVFILYDNDEAGIEGAGVLARETGWEKVFLPKYWSKDPAEFVRKTGNYLRLNDFFSNLGIGNRYYRI